MQGPAEPTFHDDSNLYPIGFKAEYRDSEAGTVFENSIMDGMDVFSEDVPAFQVKVLGSSAATFVDKKPQSVWKQVTHVMRRLRLPSEQAAWLSVCSLPSMLAR